MPAKSFLDLNNQKVKGLVSKSGSNPKDTISETQNNRGFTPDIAWKMLEEGGYSYQKKL